MLSRYNYFIVYVISIITLVILVPVGLVTVLEKLGWLVDRKTAQLLCLFFLVFIYCVISKHLNSTYRNIKLNLIKSGLFVEINSCGKIIVKNLARLLKSGKEYVINPVDCDGATVVISDNCTISLIFECDGLKNLLLVKKLPIFGCPVTASLSDTAREIVEKGYNFYPKILGEEVSNLILSLLNELCIERIVIKDGVLQITLELYGNFEMPEYAEEFYELILKIREQVTNCIWDPSISKLPLQLH